MRYVSTKNKSEKITFYPKCFLIRTGPLIPECHWIEINITVHLIYNTMLYSFWSLSYKGKIRTTPAPVLSILKDRQHRSRGAIRIVSITHKVKGLEYHVIYQTRARFSLYPLIFSIEICLVKYMNKEIKTDFFTFIFCANTTDLIFYLQQ